MSRVPFPRVPLWCLFSLGLSALPARAQLAYTDAVRTFASLSSQTVTLTGRAELHLTDTGDPLPGSTVHLNAPDAWLFFDNLKPSAVASTLLGHVRVNGAAAVADTNVRVVQYEMGAVVIPHAPDFPALEVYSGRYRSGTAKSLRTYVNYGPLELGTVGTGIRSFRLKRGYMATMAQEEDGTGISQCFVAQDGDIEVSVLRSSLEGRVKFVRVFPWRWVAKKGIAGNIEPNLNVSWLYNWNLDRNSPRDWEYVPIKQLRYWPSLSQDWRTRGATHVLGFNEPDHTDQADMTVAQAIAGWPELLGTGLRVGAPAVSDGGLSWLYSFMDAADAAGLRVDYVPVHYYRSFSNPADPTGAANQMKSFLQGIYDRVQRPIWVTEFNNGANWTGDPDPTSAQQKATVEAMIDMLDKTPWVERYSIYNWVEDVRRVVWDDNWPTAAGFSYRDNASPLALTQTMPSTSTTPVAALYPFEGSLEDAGGNGHTGLAVGAPGFTTGKSGQAIDLDGTSDYLLLPPRIGHSTDFTFMAWVQWDGGANWQRIFDFGNGTSRYLALTPKSGSNTLRFIIKNGGTEQQLNATTLPAGVWTHVAVTISGDTGKLFVNGALVNTNTSMTINPSDVATATNYLGKSQWPDPLFNGRLDEVRIYPAALTDSEVRARVIAPLPSFTAVPEASAVVRQPFRGSLAARVTGGSGARTFRKLGGPAWLAIAPDGSLSGVPTAADGGLHHATFSVTDALGAVAVTGLDVRVAEPAGLVLRLPFEGNPRASAGPFDATVTGGPVYSAGRTGSAIDFDGVDDVATLPAGALSSPEITVATWVRWDGGANWQRIFDFGNGTEEYFQLTPKSGSGTLRFEIRASGTAQQLNAPALAIGQWVHVAVTLGGGTGRLYVNGTLADTRAVTLTPEQIDPATNYLGDSQFAADPCFNGRLDDFLVFRSALSAAQVAAVMNGRAPVISQDPLAAPPATPGEVYTHTVAAAGNDADGGTLTWEKVSGPAWLSVSPSGRLSGVPGLNDSGLNRFVVRLTDSTGLADDAVVNLTVTAPADLIAHYQFDGFGLSAIGGPLATTAGSPVYGPGWFDKAIQFDGVNDVVTLPSGFLNGVTDVTFAARVLWNGGNSWQRIFDFGRGNTTQYLFLTPSSGTGTVRFGITTSGSASQQIVESADALPVGEWSHVAVTLTGNAAVLYLNGAVAGTAAITLDPAAVAPTVNYLGDSQWTADPWFGGAIDDFRVYSRGLTATEVRALAIAPDPVLIPENGYAAWAAGYTFPGGLSGPADDADKDGLPNVWEYLSGSDPAKAGSGMRLTAQPMTAAALGLAGSGTYLTVQARVLRDRAGTSLTPEAAATLAGLATPDPADALSAGPGTPDGDYEILTWYCREPVTAGSTAFLRLRITME